MPSDFRPGPRRGSRAAAFVLAHPDDEFFCLPVLAAELACGPVQVIYLTDGGPQAARRQVESLRVLGACGLDAGPVCFAGARLGWRDGALHRSVAAVRPWLGEHLSGCERVYLPAYEGGHHDHDTTFAVVASLLKDGSLGDATALQFPLYTGRGLPGPLFRCMSPIAENGEPVALRFGAREAARCWRVASAYPSQWKTWVGLGPASLAPYLVRRSILLQRVDPARIGAAPHPGVPYYQRRFRVPQDEVVAVLRTL